MDMGTVTADIAGIIFVPEIAENVKSALHAEEQQTRHLKYAKNVLIQNVRVIAQNALTA